MPISSVKDIFRGGIVLAALCAILCSALLCTLPEYALGADGDTAQQKAAVLSTGASSQWGVSFSPVKNTTQTRITLAGLSSLTKSKAADSVEITATMSYKGKQMRKVTRSVSLSSFNSKTSSATLNFGDYGKWKVTTAFKKSGKTVKTVTTDTVKVIADTYNISPVSATLPVTFFSLNLWGNDNIRKSGPVILLMERPSAYDWNNLPNGVFGLPYLSKADISYQPGDFDAASKLFRAREQIMADYVHDLLALNPSSKINLYCVDVYADLIQKIIYANKIPQNQYSIVLMSDGTYTYNKFSSTYNSSNPQSQHKKLVSEWKTARDHARANGKVDSGFGAGQCGKYLWAIVDSEPHAQLWVARKGLLETKKDNNVFGTAVQENEKVIQVSIGALLAENIQSSAQNTKEFKALYNFNDSYFADAKEQGKDVMVFLGTRVTLEESFEDYARFVMSYYGDSYAYYYKGHPSTPSDLYPEKTDQLKRLSITDVDASVAAELILFFNPEIYLSGYSSSTYASVPVGMGKGMFNMSKAEGLANLEYKNMEFWATKISSSTDKRVRDLCVSSHTNYLIEFADKIRKQKNFDIAIWDATASEIYYYKLRNGVYVLVGSAQGITGQPALVAGEYVIASNLQKDKVLDVAGGSHANGANVQLYNFNNTGAQRWRISFDKNGLATIVNVGSKRALDVSGAKRASGTNVHQWTSNNTKAQKWRIEKKKNGTFRIISALSANLVLDISGANTANGTNVQVYRNNNTKAQEFNFYPVSPQVSVSGQAKLANGFYKIASAVNTRLCLDAANWGTNNGTNLQVWSSASGANQVFSITRLSNGFYQIVNAWNNKALNVAGGRIVPGTNVLLWAPRSTSKTQQWAIFEHTGGSYTLQNVATGLMLDLAGGINANGTNVCAYSANGTQAQRWLIRASKNPYAALDTRAAASKNVLPDGTYYIKSRLSSSSVLDIAGGSKANGANAQLYTMNHTGAQIFTVTHDAKGYVSFRNKQSGRMLDVSGATRKSGANVQQYASNATRAQKWIVEKDALGNYVITSALDGKLVLDVANGSRSNGTNIWLYKANGTKAQQFTFMAAG